MLKTLRITSLAAVILAICGVLVIAVFGFKGDPEVNAVLETPSITEKFKGQQTKADKKEGDIHPLVTQAKAFALRINPPPPPKPVTPVNATPTKPKPELARPVTPPPPPRPPVVNPSFQVLATVRYETDPSKSLVLLKSANSYEWFRQGEKAGHLDIDEICDGSVIVSQGGKNSQTLYVPVKQESKSLLKGDKTAVAAARPSTASMPGAAASTAALSLENAQAGSVPTVSSARPRVLTSRVGRVRAQPPAPTPAQQKAELEQTITGIQDIMNRQDESMTDEQRQAESQMWMELLNTLKNEKEHLATAEKTDASPADAVEQSQSQPNAEESPAFSEAGEGEQMPVADQTAEVPEAPAEAEGEMPVQGEGEVGDESTQTEQAPAEAEGAAPEEGLDGRTETAEGFGDAPAESGETIPAEAGSPEGAEGQPPVGFGEAVPNEY